MFYRSNILLLHDIPVILITLTFLIRRFCSRDLPAIFLVHRFSRVLIQLNDIFLFLSLFASRLFLLSIFILILALLFIGHLFRRLFGQVFLCARLRGFTGDFHHLIEEGLSFGLCRLGLELSEPLV